MKKKNQNSIFKSATAALIRLPPKLILIICLITISLCSNNAEQVQKIPKYLSIEANRTEHYHEVFEFLQDNLFHILTEYPNNPQVKADFDELFETEHKNLKEPKTWHITVLNMDLDQNQKENIEKKAEKVKSEIYKSFEENKEVEINISTLIYVPGKIMVAPVFLDFPAGIENRIPHISLMLGGKFRAMDGNFILKSLFVENKELKGLYDEGFIKDPSFQVNLELNHVRILYEDKKKQEILDHVFLVKYDSHLKLKGITKKVYE